MAKVHKHNRIYIFPGIFILWLIFWGMSSFPSYAVELPSVKLRVKIDCVDQDGGSLNQYRMVRPDERDWELRDGFYYYRHEIDSDEPVSLFDEVFIPEDWDNAMAGRGFDIQIRAEAATDSDPDTLWIDQETEDGISLQVREFEKDKDGNEIPYVNNKSVLPGQKVSKIVRISVCQKDTEPEETVSTEDNDSASAASDGGQSVADEAKSLLYTALNSPVVQGRISASTGDVSRMMIHFAAAVAAAAAFILFIIIRQYVTGKNEGNEKSES